MCIVPLIMLNRRYLFAQLRSSLSLRTCNMALSSPPLPRAIQRTIRGRTWISCACRQLRSPSVVWQGGTGDDADASSHVPLPSTLAQGARSLRMDFNSVGCSSHLASSEATARMASSAMATVGARRRIESEQRKLRIVSQFDRADQNRISCMPPLGGTSFSSPPPMRSSYPKPLLAAPCTAPPPQTLGSP